MQPIKHNIENYSITESIIKNPDEAIKNIEQIIEAKQNSIIDNHTKITNLEFAKLFRSLVKIFGPLGSAILATICLLSTKDILASTSFFGAIMIIEASLLKGTKTNKVLTGEIESLNLDIQQEQSEIKDLTTEITYLKSLINDSQIKDQTYIDFDNIGTIKQINPITAYPERIHKPKIKTKTPGILPYTKEE